MMHQDTGYDGQDRRSISADMTLLALKFDTIHADVTEIKGAIREMTTAVNKLAVIEERLATAVSAQERAFKALSKIEERVTALEQKAPMYDKSTMWVDRVILAVIGAVLMFIWEKATKG